MKKREIKSFLKRRGFIHLRSRGDHEMWTHPERSKRPIVLCGDDGTEVPDWIIKQVQSQTGQVY